MVVLVLVGEGPRWSGEGWTTERERELGERVSGLVVGEFCLVRRMGEAVDGLGGGARPHVTVGRGKVRGGL